MLINIMWIIFLATSDYNYDPDEKSKAAKKYPLLHETIPFYLKKFDTVVGENNGHLANKKVSIS